MISFHKPKAKTIKHSCLNRRFKVSSLLLSLTFASAILFSSMTVSIVNAKSLTSKAIQQAVTKKSVTKMVGQMLMLGFNGLTPKDKGTQNIRALLATGQIGGTIFMGHNMSSKEQITKLVSYMKNGSSPKLPPLLAIDQEGGQVQRLQEKHGFTTIPTAHSIALENNKDYAFKTYQVLANELAKAGFNVNFGPVVDLNLVPQNPIIGARERSYGSSVEIVQKYSKAFVLAHRQKNILTSLKHFPGHGSSWTDSHEQFVDLSTSWKKIELDPYRLLVKEKLVDMVMVGHLYHPAFSDGQKMPASLSRKAIKGVLRTDIGYQGLVITDDLGMGAIKKYIAFEEAIILAIKAGNDILLITDGKYATTSSIKRIHKVIYEAILKGDIKIATIKKSYDRIISAKKSLAQSHIKAD